MYRLQMSQLQGLALELPPKETKSTQILNDIQAACEFNFFNNQTRVPSSSSCHVHF